MATEALLSRWPTGAQKVELVHGVIVSVGDFDKRGRVTAQRAYPGGRPVLNADGGLEIHPPGPDWPAPLVDDAPSS
ncbi:hypothetical protein ACFV2Z_35910 [Streptomyces sp. NPDC059688]|uniref:hypothetical protein n=1 Tax=Streptomyces sp. NPDC059688 TaxID=3346906 RepID=UPI00368B5BC0